MISTHLVCPNRQIRTWVLAENLFGLGLLQSVFLYKTNPNPRRLFAVGKSDPDATFGRIFSGVGLALAWGVRRFRNNIYQVYVFQPNIIW